MPYEDECVLSQGQALGRLCIVFSRLSKIEKQEKYQLTKNSNYFGQYFVVRHFGNMAQVLDNINFHYKVTR